MTCSPCVTRERTGLMLSDHCALIPLEVGHITFSMTFSSFCLPQDLESPAQVHENNLDTGTTPT